MQPVGATTLVPPLAEWHRFSMKQLAGKTAVVTGAASGMGLAFAEAFAAQGMNVVMSDVESGPLAVEAKRIGQSAEVLSMVADVSKLEQVEAMRDATLERFGAAHVLCNNAGVGGGGDVAECPIDMWEWVLNVDLWGVIYGCKTFLSGMLEQGEGHIVNTASICGQLAFGGNAPYNVAKFGVVALSETIAEEVAGTGVSVSCLCPGFVATRIIESRRNLPEDMAAQQAEPTAEELAIREAILEQFAQRKPPSEVADLVVNAIKEDQFWIFTDEHFQPRMADRAEAIQVGAGRPMIGRIADAFFE